MSYARKVGFSATSKAMRVPAEVLASILRQTGVLATLWCFIDGSPQVRGIEKETDRFGQLMVFFYGRGINKQTPMVANSAAGCCCNGMLPLSAHHHYPAHRYDEILPLGTS